MAKASRCAPPLSTAEQPAIGRYSIFQPIFSYLTFTEMASSNAVTTVDLSQYDIKKIASGKVREIFEIDEQTLLFVATDRISAYDVILNNVSIETCGMIMFLIFLLGIRNAAAMHLLRKPASNDRM